MLLFPNGLYSAAAAPAGWSGPSTGLTHRWPMDDANVSGATVSDVVGTINGTSTSTTDITSSLSGTARHFDRVGWINLSALPLTLNAAHTIGFWVNFDDLTNDGYQPTPIGFNSVSGDGGVRFTVDGTNPVVMLISGGTDLGSVIKAASIVPTSTLMHWAYTYDGAGTIKLYKDGTEVTGLLSAAGGYSLGDPNTNAFGCKATGGPYGRINASMKNVVVYNRALSGSEITTLYSAG